MKTKITLILSLLITGALHAQTNLVPNGGFEEYVECPGWSHTNADVHLAEPWIGFSADYMHTCSGQDPDTPYPELYTTPRSGEAYVRFSAYLAETNNHREYIEVELIESLEVGERYCVEYYCKLSEIGGIGTDGMGAYFTLEYTPHSSGANADFPYTPQIVSETIHNDTENYTQVYESFIAQRAFNYVTIGNFLGDEELKTEIASELPDWGGGAYYAIDDIAVYKCPLSIEEQEQLPKSYPVTGGLIIKNVKSPVSVSIYNLQGSIVATKNFSNSETWNLSYLPSGMYVYRLSDRTGSQETGKLICD